MDRIILIQPLYQNTTVNMGYKLKYPKTGVELDEKRPGTLLDSIRWL